MKVLYIMNNAKLYGGNLATLQMMLDLRTRYQIKPIALLPEEGMLTEELDKQSIEYIVKEYSNCVIDNKTCRIRPMLRYIKNNIKVVFELSEIIKEKGNIDLIHTGTSVIDIGYWLSKQLKVPHVWHVREVKEHYEIRYLLPERIVSNMFCKADAVIVISKFVQQMLYSKMKILNNLYLVYDGLDEDKAKMNRNNDKIHFCTVGIVSDKKNQMDIVKAVHKLKDEYKNYFDLTIVGDGKQLEDIKQYVKDHSLEEIICFTGYRRDVSEILDTMHVGITASEYEAFGRTTIEYMLHYMPVVASNSGANPELVHNDKNGRIYELNQVEELSEQMKYFIEHPRKITEMGIYAYSYASQNFAMEINTDQVYTVYQTILGD